MLRKLLIPLGVGTVIALLFFGLAGLAFICPAGNEEEAIQARCQADMVWFDQRLKEFKNQTGRFPTEEEGLQRAYEASVPPPSFALNAPLRTEGISYSKEPPTDPWGSPYRYGNPSKRGREYDLYSLGADGIASGDDIYYESRPRN